jgi:hypothetical protein
VEWGGSNKHQDFFTSGHIRSLYKNNIAFLAKRVNPLTGVKYADDTTIMAWNVANEGALWEHPSALPGRLSAPIDCTPTARCQGCGNGPMQNWCVRVCLCPLPRGRAHAHHVLQWRRISDVCSFIKSVAPNHLVRPRRLCEASLSGSPQRMLTGRPGARRVLWP